MRRTLLAVVVLAAASYRTAAADNFISAVGGVMLPVEDSTWTDYVDSGPKLALRIGGAGPSGVGGLFSVDWSPITTDDLGLGALAEADADRFRLLVNAYTERRMGPKLTAMVRAGAGIDVTRVHVRFLGNDYNDSDTGLALEVGGGLWFQAGESIQIGGELAIPISFHDDDSDNTIDLEEYTSFDIDVLFGVRFLMR